MNRYEIRLAGQLDPRWSDWFDGFTLTNDADGSTTLSGPVIDQAALHGLLRRVNNLGLTLISINTLDHEARARRSGTPHGTETACPWTSSDDGEHHLHGPLLPEP